MGRRLPLAGTAVLLLVVACGSRERPEAASGDAASKPVASAVVWRSRPLTDRKFERTPRVAHTCRSMACVRL